MDLLAPTLPGISFEVVTPKPQPLLPRMDIAGFVGFAATGPLHTPVAIESPEQYRDIFGSDLRLAWDRRSGRYLTSHLGRAVSAYFKGGGRRCWVVRVGQKQDPTRFMLPHLFVVDSLRPAAIFARSQGSWADRLQVGTRLKPSVVRLEYVTAVPFTTNTFELSTIGGKIIPGDLIRLSVHDNPTQFLFLLISETDGGHHRVTSRATARWVGWDAASRTWQNLPAQPLPTTSQPAARLLFDILVWEEERLLATMPALGFLPDHPRYHGKLVSDEALFAIEDIFSQERSWTAFEREILAPRFPLAAKGSNSAYLPLGMPTSVRFELAVPAPAAIRARDPLERDGVASFDADLFVDPQLAPFSSRTLMAEANQRFYLEKQAHYADGIHALLPLEEVTVLAVPDAVHPGWAKNSPTRETVLFPPEIEQPSLHSGSHLQWSALTPADDASFDVEWAEEPTFAAPSRQALSFSEAAECYQYSLTLADDCPRWWYARVRERRGSLVSPFSKTISFVYPPGDFQSCCDDLLEAPSLNRIEASPVNEQVILIVTAAASQNSCIDGSSAASRPEEAKFEIEWAGTPDFYNADVVCENGVRLDSPPILEASVPFASPNNVTFLRARQLVRGARSPWSNTVIIRPLPQPIWETVSCSDGTATADHLTAVHRAMIHMCRARKDILSLLSLPHEFNAQEAASYPERLIDARASFGSQIPAIADAADALSCAALYHPWVVTGVDQPRPPEGAIAGFMATTVLERGAWIAPANRPLADVVVLSPALTAVEENNLYLRQINPLRQTPRGFLVLSAETLSHDEALRPINVRRLLMLLYRQALREGQAFVFEPLSPAFRRLVQHRYERLLTFLYERGALAGATPAEAFQVVTDERVNTPHSLDAGRFVIELRVAPAQPLAFMTIKLVQTERVGLTLTEGNR